MPNPQTRSAIGAGALKVEVRAIVVIGGRLVAHREHRVDGEHLSLPGGRVDRGERVEDALRREVLEELGLAVHVGDLLYVAEVISGRGIADLNLFFLAELEDSRPSMIAGSCELIDLRKPHADVWPPVLEQIRADWETGWRLAARWLGNIWQVDMT